MPKNLSVLESMAACLDRKEGAIFKVGTVAHLVKPVLIDPMHIMLGAGCEDWGMCLYLSISDATKLNTALGQLLADHVARG